jgi:4-hydroxy-3-methylbut-2-en-1-yl diphosphate reductase
VRRVLAYLDDTMSKRHLNVVLASPRGFCAGVDRAIQIVERAIEKYGAPIYIRHEIVHNRHVVERLKAMGAVFVEELDECPADRPVVFSAHGVPKSVPAEAQQREMLYLDATCPLVSKVHVEAERHYEAGHEIVLIGHAGHPEVLGTMGQLPPGAVTLIETVDDVATFTPRDPERLAFVTQTTLSVDDTSDIVAALRARFPAVAAPHKEDICYATTNRQDAVKALAAQSDLVLVVGSANSSNSVRLVEVALRAGASDAHLIDEAAGIDWSWFEGVSRVGVTAGASAPEALVEEVIQALDARFDITLSEGATARETVTFKLPRVLADPA